MAVKDGDEGKLGNTHQKKKKGGGGQGGEKSQLMIPGRIPVQETEYLIFLPLASDQGF